MDSRELCFLRMHACVRMQQGYLLEKLLLNAMVHKMQLGFVGYIGYLH